MSCLRVIGKRILPLSHKMARSYYNILEPVSLRLEWRSER